jgi:TRAP-type mannitol/chloroaromatic compound transport system substrate-binding protein
MSMARTLGIGAVGIAVGLGIGWAVFKGDGGQSSTDMAAADAPAEAPAPAEETISWKMGSAYPGAVVQIGSLGKELTEKVARISGGTFKIRFYEPGALVPSKGLFDAVSQGSLEAAWSTPGYWFGKNSAFAMFSSVPFGPAAGEYIAWYYYGGGKKLMDDLYKPHNLKSIICTVIAPEASGWFRKEIKSLDDLKGLKMRFFGLGARVMEKLGVSTQLLHAKEIYPALETDVIGATEFSMPAIDLNLGFYQIAKHYYFPGWHQQSTLLELLINREVWDKLPPKRQAQLEIACGDNLREGLAQGEAIQFDALKTLKEKGVQLHRWSPEILAAMRSAWDEVVAEEAEKNPDFKKIWASYAAFRKDYKIWHDLGYLRSE